MVEGRGSSVRADAAFGGVLVIFLSSIIILFFLLLSPGNSSIKTEILSKRC